MNILLIAYHSRLRGGGGAPRLNALQHHFAAAGHSVTLICAGLRHERRDASEIAVFDPSRNHDRQGVRYFQWLGRRLAVEVCLRMGGYASIYSGWRRRAENAAAEVVCASAPDVILSSYPPVEDLEIGLHVSRQAGAPLVADFRDGLVFEPVERRALGFPAIRRRYGELEAAIAREAAAVVTVSPPLSRYFSEQLGCRRVATIPNGFDLLPPLQRLEPDPFTPGCFHVVHTGGIALSDRHCDIRSLLKGVELALNARPELKLRLRLHFAGRLSRSERSLLQPLVRAGIVLLHGHLPRPAALWLQSRADLLLLLVAPDRTSVATAKLFEYMQSRKPILALAAGTFAARIIAETGIGWVIDADSFQAVASALPAILSNQLQLPRRDELAVGRYARELQAQAYLSLLAEVCRQPTAGHE
jgi:glycosyltransferase involved in cell wall biosynthesis